ncbi:MAG TPA: pyrroline-5-carboxylate reductase [Patescibacteria group bacterium]|nr:pyrroline-5-carboxylate reductase [Patescibacteria group bacterium]
MKKLGFIGGGNMAEALAHGLIHHKLFKPSEMIVSDVAPDRRRKLARTLKVAATDDNLDVLHDANAILLAVKPQTIDAVMKELAAELAEPSGKKQAGKGKLFISIAAGVTLERLTRGLGRRARVIRVMPNAPAMVGHGMAAMVRARGATPADEAFALRIFRAVGDAVALKDEKLLDVVTALSGSGPAYVYLFAKAMADAAASEGIPRELAVRMALKTIRGAEHLMRESKREVAELIRAVASPGGTTEAALRRFAEHGFSDIVAAALHAASDRSRELGRGIN